MEFKKITLAKLADLLGITPTQLSQYMFGTIPRPKMMMKICILTEGKVDANDFYGTTRDKIEKELLKRSKIT